MTVDRGEYEKYKLFMRIDTLVRKYPAYKHDDIFYFEYDYAMMLLMLVKDDIDYARRYDKEHTRVSKLKKGRR